MKSSDSPGEGIRSVARFVIIALCIALTVAGWYYLRNWIEMGRFFVGGWDAMRDIVWWQDPGYRTFRQCYIFGESIFYPVFSSIYGFWDAIYSSFWADGYLSAYDRSSLELRIHGERCLAVAFALDGHRRSVLS